MHLNIFASPNCFVHCKGCYSLSRQEKNDKVVPTYKLIEFLKYAYYEGVHKVTICGGDPLAREDIIDLLENLKQIGFEISLDTVGTPIIKNAVSDGTKLVKKVDVRTLSNLVDMIGIPIDGSTNEVFTRFRQTKTDIIKEQIEICNELHKYGANICINTVAHQGNLEDSYELAKLISSLDYITKWQIFQFLPLGRLALKNRECFEITDKQFTEFKDSVLKVFSKENGKVQFKSSKDRTNAYMLVDNSGNAWISPEEKKIIGNINSRENWKIICSYLNIESELLSSETITKELESKDVIKKIIFNNKKNMNLSSI